MSNAGASGAAYDARVVVTNEAPEGSDRRARKERAAAEFRLRQIAWEDGNVAAAERSVAKAQAQLEAANAALKAAIAQRRGID